MTLRSFACCLLFICTISQQSFAQRRQPAAYVPDYPLNRFEKEIRAFELQDSMRGRPMNAIVFTGSSSFRYWETLAADLAPLPVVNRGFGGSTLPEVTYYANRILFPYRPSRIVIYAGDNDLTSGNHPQTPEQFMANYAAFVSLVQKQLPQTIIYFVSIKPSPSRWTKWPLVQRANQLIETFTKTHKNLRFIDIRPAMLANGRPRPDIFKADSLHMTAKGYVIWTSIIKPILVRDTKPASPPTTKQRAVRH